MYKMCVKQLKGAAPHSQVLDGPFHLLLSSLELSDTKVYGPYLRALLGPAAHFCEVVVRKLRTAPIGTALSLIILRVIRRGAHNKSMSLKCEPSSEPLQGS